MGTLKCAACGYKVNDQATACPDCGADPRTGERERDPRGVSFAAARYAPDGGKAITGSMCFTPEWIGIGSLDGAHKLGATVAMADVASVEVSGARVSQPAGDIAATYLATGLVGVAMGGTKTDCTSVLLHTRSGGAVYFEVMDQRAESLRAAVAPVLEAAGVALREGMRGASVDDIAAPQAAAAPLSVADELAKLGALRDSGVITHDEFATLKGRLIGA